MESVLELLRRNDPAVDEEFLLRVLGDVQCPAAVCHAIAQNRRYTAMYSVCVRLVEHPATPQSETAKLVHYLYWFDLLRLSVAMQVPPPSRRAIDKQLLLRVEKLTVGERISSAKRCGPTLIRVFLFDADPRVFEALLHNPRLREDDLLLLASSTRAGAQQLQLLASDPKWAFRRSIRKALVLNPVTPRSVAASQLRHLNRRDLLEILSLPTTSVYLRRCIERLRGPEEGLIRADFPAGLARNE
ncbi:MAG TPA: hypothetical protein VEZ11_14470 [Thermoanaerobaculia bacterium]|nr:hypothetical protein [Thermoanaerobaculia bacterium]